MKNWLLGKNPDAGKDWRQEENGMTDDEMVGWHHRLNRYDFEQVLGVGNRQGSLAYCSSGVAKCRTWLNNWTDWNSVGKLDSHMQKNETGPLCYITSVQFSSGVQSCPTLCYPMDCSTLGLPVHRQLPEFTQTHVHCVSDAIQPSHPMLSPSPPAFNLSQHQGLFQWVGSPHQVARVLEF